MHLMSNHFLYDPLSIFQLHKRNAFIYRFKRNTVRMRRMAPFDTPKRLIHHLYNLKANGMHFNFLYDHPSLFQFRLNFINVLLLDIGLIET